MNLSYSAKRGSSSNFQSHKKLALSSVLGDDMIEDELGTETEAEKHMKLLLQKQLNTNLSMKQHFEQHKSFTCPSTYTPLTELVKGACSLKKFKETEKDEELHQELQRCGLSEDEIYLYLKFKNRTDDSKKLIEPDIWNEKIESIKEKIKTHHEDLSKPQEFSDVKQLSRHEMELEKTLYAGCANKSILSPLVTDTKSCSSDASNKIFSHIKDLSQKLLVKCKKRNKQKSSQSYISEEVAVSPELCTENSQDFRYDPNIHHVVVPLEETEIEQKQLTLAEIRKIPRFENYEAGEPSKILYLQNLHPKITVHELQALFLRFEEENMAPLEYRIMTGRMKGQAFIKFSDYKLAEKALNFGRGYTLRGKPIIIKYGKKKSYL